MQNYRPAIRMALNAGTDKHWLIIQDFKYFYGKDKWKVKAHQQAFGWDCGGIYTVWLDGSYVRACYKWLNNGGTNKWNKSS